MITKRVFSGVQPTGSLHLGNYLGAIRNFVDLQADYECIYCVVDLHALTQWQEPEELARNTREVAAAFIASGIDPGRSVIFNQSRVAAHTQIAWIFSCVARIGWLNRMTQFKEKAGRHRENASAGLFVYPNLMAADILSYLATHVPVGEDQKQHLELTRDIAQKFNHDYGVELFPLVEPLILGEATRVMSIRDGGAKMSKSDPSEQSRINFTDSADDIARKIRRARTDAEPLPSEPAGLAGRAEAANLVGIYAALSRATPAEVLSEFGGRGFAEFKPALADLLVDRLVPISGEMRRLLGDEGHLDSILADGARRAAAIADPVRDRVYDVVGLAAR